MSSTHPRAPLQQPSSSSSEPVAKKKFGKNLNKLTKPPAPPAAGGGPGLSRGGASATSSSSRTGLLLLSTKRSSSNPTPTSSSSGGLLGSKPSSASRQLNSLSLRGDALAPKSAHDALLTAAAVAAGKVEPQPQAQQPPAWGLGEKQQPSPPSAPATSKPTPPATPTLAPKGGVSAGYHAPSQKKDDVTERAKPVSDGLGASGGTYDQGTRGRQANMATHRLAPGAPKLTTQESPADRGVASGGLHRAGASALSGDSRPGQVTLSPTQKLQPKQQNLRVEPPVASIRSTESGDSKDEGKNEKTDEQVQYMSRLARERAEKRRAEEEARMNEQKERAARRLKELEGKITNPQSSRADNGPPSRRVNDARSVTSPGAVDQGTSPSVQKKPQSPAVSEKNRRQQNQKVSGRSPLGGSGSEIVLERLGRTKKGVSDAGASSLAGGGSAPASGFRSSSVPGNGSKKLFDPNRTYSSLVGGSSAPQPGSNSGAEEAGGGKDTNEGKLTREQDSHHEARSSRKDDQPPIHMIHLSSYEDSDRGGRGGVSGPRMLFDPKSGSMVAAPDSSSGAKSGRKERAKQKSRNIRDRDGKDRGDSGPGQLVSLMKRPTSASSTDVGPMSISRRRSPSEDANVPGESLGQKASRKQKGRKDDPVSQRKDRKQKNLVSDTPISPRPDFSVGTTLHSAVSPASKARQSSGRSANGRQLKQTVPGERRMPRTCGVLYKMDENGTYVCADGCEADQGYGAHSVPGGRVRNPVAHAKFLEQQEKLKVEAIRSGTTASPFGGVENFTGRYKEQRQNESSIAQSRFDDQLRADPSLWKHQVDFEQQQQRLLAEASSVLLDDTPKREPVSDEFPAPVTVKPNESVESSESPTLQAQADPWAHSEAALVAAAAAAAANVTNDNQLRPGSADIADEEDSDEDDGLDFQSPSFMGLGFDPTENMDSVMMSPSHAAVGKVDPIDLTSLALDAARAGSAEPSSSNQSNPFGTLGDPSRFLGSSTWGAAGPAGGSNTDLASIGALANWDFSGNSEAGSSPVQTSDGVGQQQEQQQPPASFLSLSNLPVSGESTWGSGGFTGGFGGLGSFGAAQSSANSGGHDTD